MKLFDTPYLQRALNNNDEQLKFAKLLLKLSNEDGDKAASLVNKLIVDFQAIQVERSKEVMLLSVVTEVLTMSDNKMPWLMLRLRIENALSTKRLSNLREIGRAHV